MHSFILSTPRDQNGMTRVAGPNYQSASIDGPIIATTPKPAVTTRLPTGGEMAIPFVGCLIATILSDRQQAVFIMCATRAGAIPVLTAEAMALGDC